MWGFLNITDSISDRKKSGEMRVEREVILSATTPILHIVPGKVIGSVGHEVWVIGPVGYLSPHEKGWWVNRERNTGYFWIRLIVVE